jgi:hypothetical protein
VEYWIFTSRLRRLKFIFGITRSRITETTRASLKSGASTRPPRSTTSSTNPGRRGILRSVRPELITGAADDDPSAIGTYASAGAAIGPSFLWTSPVLWTSPITFPTIFAVVYLSAKLRQGTGAALFDNPRSNFPSWLVIRRSYKHTCAATFRVFRRILP